MGGSTSKKRAEECRSRHGYSQKCFEYVFNNLSPTCSYSDRSPTAYAPSSTTTSSEPSHHTATSQPQPSAPLRPDPLVDEEERQVDMAIWASLKAPNISRASSTLSMNPSYPYDDEEERQIDMAIRASLKVPNPPRASSTLGMDPSYGQDCRSSRFDIGSSTTSSQPRRSMPYAQHIPDHFSHESVECGICFEASMPAICDPCGHVCCYECLLQIQGSTNRCPRCREAITKVMKIYM